MRGRLVRAWLRGALRQPARGMVVVMALVIMTVGAGGALVAGDSLDRLFVQDAHAEWGDVDVEVTSTEDGHFSEGLARLVGVESDAHSAAWAPRLVLAGVARSAGRQEPDVQVLGLGSEEQMYPALEPVAGQADVLRLAADEVLVNRRLATRLELAVGDAIDLLIAVPQTLDRALNGGIERRRLARSATLTATIAGVVEDAGVADLHRTPNVLLRRDILQRLTDLPGSVNVLHMTAPSRTADATDRLVTTLEPQLRRLGLESDDVLQDQLLIAEDEGGQFRSILITLAILVIVAASIATTQLVTAMAEDRSEEVGLLRTLGVPARSIVRLMMLEAAIYGVVAAALGILVAIPLADFLAASLADHFAALSAGRGREQVVLAGGAETGTLLTAAVIVVAVAAWSGRVAGRRLAAVELDQLLRGPLEQLPAVGLDPRRPAWLMASGALLLGMGLGGGPASDALRFLGLTLLFAARWTGRRRTAADPDRVDRDYAIGALVWATVGAGLLADFSQGYETGFGILVVAGIVSVVGVTVLVARRFRSVMRFVRAYVPRGAWQVALRTAGAYAEESRGRTGRLHATFGVVLFVAAALHVLGSAMQVPVVKQAGSFDVLATSVAPLERAQFAQAPGVGLAVAMPSTFVAEDVFGVVADSDPGETLRVRWPVRLIGTSDEFARAQAFQLAAALPEYPSARAALAAVARDADKAVLDRYARPPGAQPGDQVVLDLGPGLRQYELIAVLDTFLLDAVFVSESEFHALVPSPGPNVVLARTDERATPDVLVSTLEQAGHAEGVAAKTVTTVAAEVVSVNRTFTDVFALMLLLGLGVALTAVAATLFRSVHERAPYLAVLQTIGVPRWAIALAAASEPVMVAVLGTIAGLGVGLAVLRALFAAGFSDLAFVVDVGQAAAVLGTIVAALVVTSLGAVLASMRAVDLARLRTTFD